MFTRQKSPGRMVVQEIEFRFRHPVEVRFRDIDIGGHAHHGEALVYIEGATLTDYIDRVGGYTARADESKHLVLRRNSEVVPLLNGRTDIVIVPGDEIIALPAIPSNTVEIVQLVTETIFRIAAAAAIFIGVK